jgi:hypothetical protein
MRVASKSAQTDVSTSWEEAWMSRQSMLELRRYCFAHSSSKAALQWSPSYYQINMEYRLDSANRNCEFRAAEYFMLELYLKL